MIIGGDITEKDRYAAVRELAGITSITMSDQILTRKINTSDAAARSYFGTATRTYDGSEPEFQNVVTVSNLLCSALIRQGIGGSENISAASEQISLAKSLVEATNQIAPEQGADVANKTSGIGGYKRGSFG